MCCSCPPAYASNDDCNAKAGVEDGQAMKVYTIRWMHQYEANVCQEVFRTKAAAMQRVRDYLADSGRKYVAQPGPAEGNEEDDGSLMWWKAPSDFISLNCYDVKP